MNLNAKSDLNVMWYQEQYENHHNRIFVNGAFMGRGYFSAIQCSRGGCRYEIWDLWSVTIVSRMWHLH